MLAEEVRRERRGVVDEAGGVDGGEEFGKKTHGTGGCGLPSIVRGILA